MYFFPFTSKTFSLLLPEKCCAMRLVIFVVQLLWPVIYEKFTSCGGLFLWCNLRGLLFLQKMPRALDDFCDATFVACHLCKVALCDFPSTIFAACHFFASCTVWWVFLKSNFCCLSFLRNLFCVVGDFRSTTYHTT